jgi:hypothetical protein
VTLQSDDCDLLFLVRLGVSTLLVFTWPLEKYFSLERPPRIATFPTAEVQTELYTPCTTRTLTGVVADHEHFLLFFYEQLRETGDARTALEICPFHSLHQEKKRMGCTGM